MKSGPQTGGSLLGNLRRVDWTGGLIFIAGSSTFLIGLTWAGVDYAWSSYQTWLPMLLGGLAVVGSLIYENFVPSEPFLHLSVYYSLHASIVFFLTLMQGLMVSPAIPQLVSITQKATLLRYAISYTCNSITFRSTFK
jgi:hypothetical protein